ncbi:thioredoxin family protein [Leifsonia sp. L25]|uniref:thioredoxin family protein n=1 Tax=Leifsonia sp. L25 TaxID=3423957 RepID=UPI003D685F56
MSQLPPNPTNLRGAVDLSGLVNRPQPGQGDAGGAAPGEPVELPSLFFQGTDANFNDFIDLSMRIPVVVALTASWADPDRALATVLDRVTTDLAGRIVLVQVDVDANPQLVQAFQAQSAPAVAGIVAGRPVQLFTGALPEDQVRDVFAQLLELAAQNGVTGSAQIDAAAGRPRAPTPTPTPTSPRRSRRCPRCTPRRTTRSTAATIPRPSPPTRPRSPRIRATRWRSPGSRR